MAVNSRDLSSREQNRSWVEAKVFRHARGARRIITSIGRIPHRRRRRGKEDRQKRNDQFHHFWTPLSLRQHSFARGYVSRTWLFLPRTSIRILSRIRSRIYVNFYDIRHNYLSRAMFEIYSPIFPGMTSNWAGASLTKMGRLHNS